MAAISITAAGPAAVTLRALRQLGQHDRDAADSMRRLATGIRISRGADGPAQLVGLPIRRGTHSAVRAAAGNVDRTSAVLATAEGALVEAASLMDDLRRLIVESASAAAWTAAERQANQQQIDAILGAIDRVLGSATFAGQRLFAREGGFDVSGVSSAVHRFDVERADRIRAGPIPVDVVVTASARVGGMAVILGAPALELPSRDRFFELEIRGNRGARAFAFASGVTITQIARAINDAASTTGVRATPLVETDDGGFGGPEPVDPPEDGDPIPAPPIDPDAPPVGIRLWSEDYGDDQFVSVRVRDDGGLAGGSGVGLFPLAASSQLAADPSPSRRLAGFGDARFWITQHGRDVEATVNGVRAATRGTAVRIDRTDLALAIELDDDLGGPGALTLGRFRALTIDAGGLRVQAGHRVDADGSFIIALPRLDTLTLGGITRDGRALRLADLRGGGPADLDSGRHDLAMPIVDRADDQLIALAGRLGALQADALDAWRGQMSRLGEGIASAERTVIDTDTAAESAQFLRTTVLRQAMRRALDAVPSAIALDLLRGVLPPA